MHSVGGWVSWFLRCIRRFTRRPRLAERSAHPRPAVACEGERVDCLLLDGCNLPLSLLARARPASGFALVSRSEGSEEDWSELLASVAGAPPRPFAAARVLFDGHSAPGRLLGETTERLTAAVDAYATHPGRIADDALVELVARRALTDGAAEEPATPKEAAAALGSAGRKLADAPAASADDWFVVRRVGGGERAFARLWRRLGLIRTEGARLSTPSAPCSSLRLRHAHSVHPQTARHPLGDAKLIADPPPPVRVPRVPAHPHAVRQF